MLFTYNDVRPITDYGAAHGAFIRCRGFFLPFLNKRRKGDMTSNCRFHSSVVPLLFDYLDGVGCRA